VTSPQRASAPAAEALPAGMKTVPIEQAVGMVLCHDLTQIVPGEFKGAAFRKGHIVRDEDIPRLLDMGKRSIFVFDLDAGLVHEDDAALRIGGAAAGAGVYLTGPREGKVELVAAEAGLLKVDSDLLRAVNRIEDVMMATLHSNTPVESGRTLAGTRVIPLVVPEERVQQVERLCASGRPVLRVLPFRRLKVGVVSTGSEVFSGRIEDRFGPVISAKVEAYSSSILRQVFVPDSREDVAAAISSLVEEGADMVAVTGGMSVDPDDVSPAGIRLAGARVVTYGAPTLPGAMFMLAYLGELPVLGLPGCVMYSRTSIFDLVLPRLLAGEVLTRGDIIDLAPGGLCLGCEVCRYPDCSFGKGAR
jgi:hypothetical protein